METNQNLLSDAPFRYLTPDDQQHPFSYVHHLFQYETDVDFLRDDISDLIRSAFSTHDAGLLRKGRLQDYAATQRRLTRMMEIAFRITQVTPEITLPENHPWQKTVHRLSDPNRTLRPKTGYFRQLGVLNYEEVTRPIQSLNAFFAYKTPEEWQVLLDDLLRYAYHKDNPFGTNKQGLAFKIIDELERLTETLYVIHEIRIWDRTKGTEADQ